MRDCHAFVTRYVTRESRYPVPSRPYPTRPALYIERGETSHHGVQLVTREAVTP
jgi:hypothetical protein